MSDRDEAMDGSLGIGKTVDAPAERPHYQGHDETKAFPSRFRSFDLILELGFEN